jgi:hypothetical protein
MTTILLNFRPEFAPLVESGRKPHTVRARRADGRDPLPGDTLHLYTGLPTKATRLLRQEPCEFTIEITIQQSAGNVHHILLGGVPLGQNEIEALARADGFEHGTAFVQYFAHQYGLPFTGLLIGWEPAPTYATRH